MNPIPVSPHRVRMPIYFAVVGLAMLMSPVAHAGKECGAIKATIVSGAAKLATYKAGDKLSVPASKMPAGAIMKVRGDFVSYDVALDSFEVRNYTLTGKAGKGQITDEPTPVYVTKTPDVGVLSGDMSLKIDKGGSMVVQRGSSTKAKIQSKDCTQGGVFQMEPSPTANETNTLAPGFRYCYQATPSSSLFFTNDVVLGYDSPETASLLGGGAGGNQALWEVTGGGRIGMVVGEDADEKIIEQSGSIDAGGLCPHQKVDD